MTDRTPSTEQRSVEIEVTEGVVTITTNPAGECVAVTRCDSEGRILKVIWERRSAPEPSESDCTLDYITKRQAFELVRIGTWDLETFRRWCSTHEPAEKPVWDQPTLVEIRAAVNGAYSQVSFGRYATALDTLGRLSQIVATLERHLSTTKRDFE